MQFAGISGHLKRFLEKMRQDPDLNRKFREESVQPFCSPSAKKSLGKFSQVGRLLRKVPRNSYCMIVVIIKKISARIRI
jgi:hypothetical protein